MLTTGIFPNKIEKSRVFHLYKSGDKEHVNNYRPNSLLSAFPKIF